jgi:hypothetical protein
MSKPISLALLLLLVAACDTTAPTSGQLRLNSEDTFHYTATSGLGRPLLVGTLTLAWANTDTTMPRGITGTWAIDWAPGADRSVHVGSQVGTGEISGVATETGVTFDLNPGYVDDNVILRARVEGTRLIGDWTWATITGPGVKGEFTASATH